MESHSIFPDDHFYNIVFFELNKEHEKSKDFKNSRLLNE